jgi:hypothetical protein
MRTLKILMISLLLAAFAEITNAQVTISGTVADKKHPLPGVSITLKDTYDGATSDSSGKFSFKTTEKGEFDIVVTAVGYKLFEQKVNIVTTPVVLEILLKEEFTELEAVVLSAGTFEASDKKRAAAVLTPIDIVTTASAEGDLTGALKTLPGAQQVGDSDGLIV